jgi:hypothetical protein
MTIDEKDLKGYLRDLVKFMKESCDAFDLGVPGEAKRLAVCIRILVHDMDQAPSLLTRLGSKDILFYDECPVYRPELGLPFSGLAVVTIGGPKPRYTPRLGLNPRIQMKKVTFKEWWNKVVVADPEKKVTLTRATIILNVANSVGGPTESRLDAAYEKLTQAYFNGPVADIEGGTPYDAQIEFASVRQIAFELMRSLVEQLPEFFQALPH